LVNRTSYVAPHHATFFAYLPLALP